MGMTKSCILVKLKQEEFILNEKKLKYLGFLSFVIKININQ